VVAEKPARAELRLDFILKVHVIVPVLELNVALKGDEKFDKGVFP
jgi:hypothetical protein